MLNDNNMVTTGSLHAAFLNGFYESEVNIAYSFNNQPFNLVYQLVDGIYPETAKIENTVFVLANAKERAFAKL